MLWFKKKTAEHLAAPGVQTHMNNSVTTTRWEHFEHEADVGIRGIGPTIETAFEQAALAMTAVITDPKKIEANQKIEISAEATDPELLLADWLNSLLYEMATRSMLFGRFEVAIENNKLKAAAWGQKTDIKKHTPAVEVKAATYAELSVRKNDDGSWIAQCIVDV
jgi:SHS2 domain-containing protein